MSHNTSHRLIINQSESTDSGDATEYVQSKEKDNGSKEKITVHRTVHNIASLLRVILRITQRFNVLHPYFRKYRYHCRSFRRRSQGEGASCKMKKLVEQLLELFCERNEFAYSACESLDLGIVFDNVLGHIFCNKCTDIRGSGTACVRFLYI
jgi:hypothetical protein